MAVTISTYNHTIKLLQNEELTITTLKVMLLNNSATFTASHTALTSVSNAGAYEVSGNGWDAGGEALASEAITTVDTDGAMLDAADLTVTATGGDIGPAYKAVIYDDSDANDAPLFFIDFGEAKTAGVGTDFKFLWNASGIARTTNP